VTDEEFKKEKDELFDMLDTFRLIQDRGERRILHFCPSPST